MDLFRTSGLASQADIVERVLSFLPVPDVCRYRTVSKQWNDLLRDRHFIVLHAQNLAKSHDANFIVLRCVRSYNFPELPGEGIVFASGSCILDLKAKRWYQVKDLNQVPFILRSPTLEAIDGGLVCRTIRTLNGNWLTVHNLMDEEAKDLPVAPWPMTSPLLPEPGLVVDSISKTFKVFLVNHSYDKTEKLNDPNTSEDERLQIQNDPLVRVYDSATNEWQSLTNPDWDIRVVPQLCCFVVFHGQLVLLMALEFDPLWAYSLAEDKWSLIQADLDPNVGDNLYDPKLVVSANRLFLVSWSRLWSRRHPGAEYCYFVVEEVKISERRIDLVYALLREQVVSRFDIQLAMDGEIPKMIVIGFGTSLMVMSNASGKCQVFNVVTLSWDDEDLPQNPLGLLPDGEDRVWVGKYMNLLLPNTPW